MIGTDKNIPQQNNSGKKQDTSNNSESVAEALQQAQKDIERDPDLINKPDPAADLDEGELARLEGEE
ncbi:MAG: hypothetical protein JWO92_2369 [Chitinophagaceae bacterium]|nr:hypothetical protein [Chitinophagaceae bacterium]